MSPRMNGVWTKFNDAFAPPPLAKAAKLFNNQNNQKDSFLHNDTASARHVAHIRESDGIELLWRTSSTISKFGDAPCPFNIGLSINIICFAVCCVCWCCVLCMLCAMMMLCSCMFDVSSQNWFETEINKNSQTRQDLWRHVRGRCHTGKRYTHYTQHLFLVFDIDGIRYRCVRCRCSST